MRHPFELELSELETINFAIQELADEASEQVAGGFATSDSPCEEGGSPKPSTRRRGEEGGGCPTTLKIGEQGCSTTESTKETGGG